MAGHPATTGGLARLCGRRDLHAPASRTPRPSPLPPERRRLVVVATALLLTVGAGLLVGGALTEAWALTITGAAILVSATVVLSLTMVPPESTGAAREPATNAAPFEVPLFERLSDPVLLVDRAGKVL